MREDDRVRVRHMIDAAEQVARFIVGRVREDFDTDLMLLFAVVRAIEIIGEAAWRVSEETRAVTSGVPWKAVIGMRNRIIHAYFDIDKDIVWKAAAEEVPDLLQRLRSMPDVDGR
jgi:uncharacterized protein with HEPN domain